VSTDVDFPTATRPPAPPARLEPPQSPSAHQPDLLPFAWEADPAGPDLGERETLFRFPAAHDPAPSTPRLLAMSIYGTILGLAGVGVGLRAFASVFGGSAPFWYVPLLAFIGLIGVALAVGAFLSVHRRFLPWCLFLLAAGPLVGDVMLATSY
jgi:hypothetical protein